LPRLAAAGPPPAGPAEADGLAPREPTAKAAINGQGAVLRVAIGLARLLSATRRSCDARSAAVPRGPLGAPETRVANRTLGLLVGLLAPLLAACAGQPPPRATVEEAELLPLLVVRHAWHTGVIAPAAALPADSPFRIAFPEADWLELGWGDRLYYPHPDPPLWMALRAALWPTASAVNLTAHHGPAEAIPGEELFLLEVSAAGLARLHERALRALELDAGGRPIPIGRGRGPDSPFWASPEPFHLFRTCNHWTAELMRAAGLPVVPFGTVTTGDLFRQIEPFARRLRRRRPATGARPPGARQGRARAPRARCGREACPGYGEVRCQRPEAREQQENRQRQHRAGSPIVHRPPSARKG
jgi:hypothetical protein